MPSLYKLFIWMLIFFIVGGPLPLMILIYYWQRVEMRWRNLWTRIQEYNLEKEFLRIYQFAEWEIVKDKSLQEVRDNVGKEFKARYRGENNFLYYVFPFLLTLGTTSSFSQLVYDALMGATSLETLMDRAAILPFAVAGALLYIYPHYLSRFASLHLSPSCLLELIGKLWFAFVLGILFGYCSPVEIGKPIAAFLGGYLPFAVLDLLKDKAFGGKKDVVPQGEATPSADFLEIIEKDEDLRSQLNLMGIRTVLELAYANPIKLFIETDLELDVCIYTIDRANLYLFVPEAAVRSGLNRIGIKTAIDLMTQLYEYPDTWIESEEELPAHLVKTLNEIKGVMGLQDIATLRNILDMMREDPKLAYLLDFWQRISFGIDENIKRLQEEPGNDEGPGLQGSTPGLGYS